MVLLDNLILLIVIVAVFAAATYLSLTIKHKKLIPAIVSGVIELGAVIVLLFKGASIEELFLMILVFGCVTVVLNFFCRDNAKNKASDHEKTDNE